MWIQAHNWFITNIMDCEFLKKSNLIGRKGSSGRLFEAVVPDRLAAKPKQIEFQNNILGFFCQNKFNVIELINNISKNKNETEDNKPNYIYANCKMYLYRKQHCIKTLSVHSNYLVLVYSEIRASVYSIKAMFIPKCENVGRVRYRLIGLWNSHLFN